MKKFTICLLVCLITSSASPIPDSTTSNEDTWSIRYFVAPTQKRYTTWCVHACLEMVFGLPQCESANRWIILPFHDCCGILSIDDQCIIRGAIPRGAIQTFLREQFSPIQGGITHLWTFFSGPTPDIAFLSVQSSTGYHLMTLLEVIKSGDYRNVIRYCDPNYGDIIQTPTPNNIEIIY